MITKENDRCKSIFKKFDKNNIILLFFEVNKKWNLEPVTEVQIEKTVNDMRETLETKYTSEADKRAQNRIKLLQLETKHMNFIVS